MICIMTHEKNIDQGIQIYMLSLKENSYQYNLYTKKQRMMYSIHMVLSITDRDLRNHPSSSRWGTAINKYFEKNIFLLTMYHRSNSYIYSMNMSYILHHIPCKYRYEEQIQKSDISQNIFHHPKDIQDHISYNQQHCISHNCLYKNHSSK